MPWISPLLEQEKERKREAFNKLVEENPDLVKSTEEYNKGLQQYLSSGTLPTSRTEEVRTTEGDKTETPLPGGRGVAVQFPETAVSQESNPITFGPPQEDIVRVKDGKMVYLTGSPDDKKPVKVLTAAEAGDSPETLDKLLADRVKNGDMSLEDAVSLKSKTGSGAYALTKEEQNAIVAATQRANNPLPTSLLTSRGPKAKVLAQALMENPNYDPTTSEVSFSTAKRGAESEAGQRGRALGSIRPMADSLEDILDYAAPLIKVLSPTQISAVNSAYRRGLAQINDPDANRLLTHMNEATAMYASIMKGGTAAPTDDQFKDAKRIISGGLSPSGFSGVSDAIRKAARSRVKRLEQSPRQSEGGSSDKGQPQGGGDSTPDKFGYVVGQQYKMKDGQMATYAGNGEFE